MPKIQYYHYDGIPCRVTIEDAVNRMAAEGYFPGQGFLPVPVTDILFKGEVITEAEFRSTVVAMKGQG
jgi:hypothetical protein